MYDKLYALMKAHEKEGFFTYAPVDNALIRDAEEKLKVRLPQSYQWFLKTFGHGGIGGIEVLGVGKNKRAIFVEETLRLRLYGFPVELIAIENCDEWVYGINTNDDTIVMWEAKDNAYEKAYDNFEMYLTDRIQDVLENME